MPCKWLASLHEFTFWQLPGAEELDQAVLDGRRIGWLSEGTHLKHEGVLVGGACVQQLAQRLAPAQPSPSRPLHSS